MREARAAATAAAAAPRATATRSRAARRTRSAKRLWRPGRRVRWRGGGALARTTLEEMAVERKAHARVTPSALRATGGGRTRGSRGEKVRVRSYAGAAAAGAAAENPPLCWRRGNGGGIECSRTIEATNDAMREDALMRRGELEGLTRDSPRLARRRRSGVSRRSRRLDYSQGARRMRTLLGRRRPHASVASSRFGEDDDDDEPAGCE